MLSPWMFVLLLLIWRAAGFMPPPRGPPRSRSFQRDGRGGGYDGPSRGDNAYPMVVSFNYSITETENDVLDLRQQPLDRSQSITDCLEARGGDDRAGNRVATQVVYYWKVRIQQVATAVAEKVSYPYKRLAQQLRRRNNNNKPPGQQSESTTSPEADEMQRLLRSTPVQRVTVPNSTALPHDVIEAATQQSKILGRPLSEGSESLQDLVTRLNRWYQEQGLVFHMVTGATLKPETATAELTVQEPRFGKDPIGITVYKEMVPDPVTNELLSKRQYRQRYGMEIGNNNNRTTLVPTAGHVQPHRIAQAMQMKPGEPFRIDPARWDKTVASSGLFSSVLQTSPLLLPDGTLQLHIAAKEAPMKQLEYGIGKSLYTGGWEGEMEFRHGNVLGGGETLQVNVRKAAEDGRSNSLHVTFNEGRLMSGGGDGYHLEAYSENYQDRGASSSTTPLFRQRQGASIRVHTPYLLPKSTLTESLERHTADTADSPAEVVASSTVNIGPYQVGRQRFPFANARANVDASVTFGVRVAGQEESDRIPYATASTTTRQLIPIGRTRMQLALKHTAVASTPNLPHHVARTIRTITKIRGSPTGAAKLMHSNNSAAMVKGTTELRIPVPSPQSWIKQDRDDASVVLFVDYLLTPLAEQRRTTTMSAGIGIRKSFQGIPLQCDLVLSSSGKFKPILGIGSDFVF
jgi:hypothetical protein